MLAGEDAVKAAAEKYLPRLESQSDDEYKAYRERAAYLGAQMWNSPLQCSSPSNSNRPS